MSKNLFKRALSLTAAAFMGIMASVSQMPPVKASAAPAPVYENACATTPAVTTTLLGRTAFEFDAPKDNITVGEEMTVTLINTYTDSVWDRDELPEFSIGDPEVVSVEKGDETGTFKVTGLSTGSTFVRFIYNGYADFIINVTDENGELVTQTNAVTTTTTTVPDTTTSVSPEGFVFNPPNATLKIGEEITVEILNAGTLERWSGNTLPECVIGKTQNVTVEDGEEKGTFKVKGVIPGSTYVRYMKNGYDGYGDFRVTVLDESVTQTGVSTTAETTLPTTTAPLNTVSTTTTPGETVTSLQSSPQTTTTTAGLKLRCEPDVVQLKEGESQYVELYVGSMQYSGDYPEFRVDADDIAGIGPCDYTWGFYVTGIMDGGTYAEITVDYMGQKLTAELPIDVLPKNVNTDTTGDTGTTMGSSTTATFPTTTAPIYTVTTTTVPTKDTVTSLQSTPQTTTTVELISFCCRPYEVQIKEGEKQYVEVYLNSELIPADSVDIMVDIEDVADITLSEDGKGFYVNGRISGGTYAEITLEYNGEKLYTSLPINVLPENYTTDMTGDTGTTMGSSTTATLPTTTAPSNTVTTTTDPFGNTVTTPNSSTGTVPTYTTSVPGSSTTYDSSTAPITVYTSTASTADTTATVQGIKLSESTVTISAGQRFGLGVTLYDGSDYGGALVNAVSDNPAVAIAQYSDIPYSFYIVGVSEGTAHFTVYDRVYGSTAELDVTVTASETGEEFHGLEITIDSLPDKLTYNIGEELDLTGGVFSAVAYESMTDPDSTQHLLIDKAEMTEYNVITDAFDSTTPGTYPIIISKNHNIYGGWDVEVFYVTVSGTGDINSDGTVDISDASNVLSIYAMAAAGMEIAFENAAAADINGDGKADLTDAGLILTYYAKTAAGISCTWDDIIS